MKNKVYWIIGITLGIVILIAVIYINYLSKDNNEVTNIQNLKSNLNNDYSKEIVSGYLIFKTKSCSFKTSNPPYPDDSPCASNSGYIILSDDKNAKISNDPTNSKTSLKNNEILIHYVKDDAIDYFSLGNFYQIAGKDISYNSVNSLEFSDYVENIQIAR